MDLLTKYGNASITYDTIGNMLSDGTWTYTWKQGRQLASMSKSGANWSFTYDADGMRTKRTNGSTTYSYIYDGSQLSAMSVGSNQLYFSYDAFGTPQAVVYNGTQYRYITNLQGDIVEIRDANDSTVVTYTYDAWGKLLDITGTKANTLGTHNPLRYRGYVYDTETGLYYLQSRYYNPTIGRFINADALVSTGQGVLGNNMFAYCLNNPIDLQDPAGTCPATLTVNHKIDNKMACSCGGSALEGFVHGNYSNFDAEDLFSETRHIVSNITRKEANDYYDIIKDGDYGRMLLLDPIPYSFGFAGKGGDLLSVLYDLLTGVRDLSHTSIYDPKDRLLYVEEGYHVITWNRVFLFDTAVATETEYFIYDNDWNLVFNDVIIDTYITD